uniref:uncharacterized protein LOC122598284 n=1 Tax=Erigeron canadensis TaxID=72917 RepID=UPI001CB8F1D1|nr:uncharacterized protein LOC122598284 [Erigeron canadensis]XP_043626815.1 uncharacterized protein LOC122598284 [Erigeron canadensis]
MAHIFDLPDEILSTVMILLAMSCTGAVDLARLSATCKRFLNLATQPLVLEVVNFDEVPVCSYERHHHINDLLCLCARVGNRDAELMLAKALLNIDFFFWDMIMEQGRPHLVENPSGIGLLCHVRLVRTFIDFASDNHIVCMRMPLFRYIISFLGYKQMCTSGLLLALRNMVNYLRFEQAELLLYAQEDVGNDMPSNEPDNEMVQLALELGDVYRDRVLEIYDEVFHVC